MGPWGPKSGQSRQKIATSPINWSRGPIFGWKQLIQIETRLGVSGWTRHGPLGQFVLPKDYLFYLFAPFGPLCFHIWDSLSIAMAKTSLSGFPLCCSYLVPTHYSKMHVIGAYLAYQSWPLLTPFGGNGQIYSMFWPENSHHLVSPDVPVVFRPCYSPSNKSRPSGPIGMVNVWFLDQLRWQWGCSCPFFALLGMYLGYSESGKSAKMVILNVLNTPHISLCTANSERLLPSCQCWSQTKRVITDFLFIHPWRRPAF